MGTNYYDPWLFSKAEKALEIDVYRGEPYLYTNLPTTTYSAYKDAVAAAYSSAPPLYQKLIDYHLSALTEVVGSGVTTDPDYWSASSINGTYIINSGITTSRVGIGTMNPSYTLTVSGDVGVNEYIYHNGDADTYLRFAPDLVNLVAGGKSVIKLDESGSNDNILINNTNADIDLYVMGDAGTPIIATDAANDRVGINNIIPNNALSVSGSVSASSFVYASTVDTANLKIGGAQGSDGQVLTSTGSGVAWEDSGGGSSSSYWSASSVNPTFIVNSGVTSSANPNKVGIGTLIPNKELSVSGTVSATTAVYVGTGSGILSGLTFHAPLYNSDYFKSYTGAQSTYFGYLAGTNHSSNDQFNLGVGWKAMGIGSLSGSAIKNTAIGTVSMAYLESGQYNVAVGSGSLGALKDGDHNTCVGEAAGLGIKYSNKNTGIGYGVFYIGNAAIGDEPLGDTENTAVGYSSQYYLTEGRWNTSMGSKSLQGSLFTVGVGSTGNTVIGYGANSANTQGSYNTSLGTGVAKANTTGDYNITIGAYTNVETATADYQLNIGDTIIGKDLVGDNLSINAVGIGTAVTNSLLTHTFTVSGDTLINGDLVCSGDIDGGTF